jgi:type III secretory pathway component EscT
MAAVSLSQTHELEHALAVLLLLTSRLLPSAWCLTWSLSSFVLRIALGIALSLSLLPFALRVAPAELAIGPQLWAAIPWELARGVLLGLGALLPVIALSWVGRVQDASRDGLAGSEDPSPLERLYGAAAIAVLFATGTHALVFRTLAGSLSDLPLGAAGATLTAAQPVFLELAQLVVRAFELSIVLAAPVLLVISTSLAIAAASARISGPLAAALLRGPLLPVVGLSAACLSISSILSSLPQALSVFVQKALALLPGLQ